jgi:hypothetical protein
MALPGGSLKESIRWVLFRGRRSIPAEIDEEFEGLATKKGGRSLLLEPDFL